MNKTTESNTDVNVITSFDPSQEQKEASDNPSATEIIIEDGIEKEVPVDPVAELPEGANPFEAVSPKPTGQIDSNFFNQEQEWEATIIGQTPEGRTVQVKKRQMSHGYEISYRNGAAVPKELQGWFTSYDVAEKTARTFLNRKWDEVKAEAVSAQG